jgi:hypothetical protein
MTTECQIYQFLENDLGNVCRIYKRKFIISNTKIRTYNSCVLNKRNIRKQVLVKKKLAEVQDINTFYTIQYTFCMIECAYRPGTFRQSERRYYLD